MPAGMNGDHERDIEGLQARLVAAAERHPLLPIEPDWWQERILDWASADPEFRTRLLRFVDVLPALRTPAAVGDHLRQYFRDAGPRPVRVGSQLATQPLLRPAVSTMVRQAVFAMSQRFIAGSRPEEALPHLQRLAEAGVGYSVDLLGEATLSDREADAYRDRYLTLIQGLTAAGSRIAPQGDGWAGVPPVNVSVKLSALCSHFEPAAPEWVLSNIRGRLAGLLGEARELGAHVHFDMEQYRFKGLCHHVFAAIAGDPQFADWPDFGIVVQAYLRDAENDLRSLHALAEARGAPITVRLVKGAYWDEERVFALQNGWPVPVYQTKAETDACYERCTDLLLDAWPHLRPAFGTHNPRSIAQAAVKARERGRGTDEIEFQMLYGMAEDIRTAVQAEGFRTRVYVPVGEVIPGMGYLVRRLLENSSNLAWFRSDGNARRPDRLGLPPPSAGPKRLGGRTHVFGNAPPVMFFEPGPRERMQAALDGVRSASGGFYPLLLAADQASGLSYAEVRYPADPTCLLGHVAQGTTRDVEIAVEQAGRAFPRWRDQGAPGRAEVLRRAAGLLEERRYELAAWMVYESAKPWYEADGDVTEAIDYLRYYAAAAERMRAPERLGGLPGEENDYFYEARGVAAIIAPWNFPLAIITGMTSAALAAGNAAILKPSEQSPIIAFRLVELLRQAGVPPAIVQYLPGPGEEVGKALVEHPGVDIIAFTGSSAVGLFILQGASRIRTLRGGLKRVIAEMGGKNAMVLDEDADLDQSLSDVLASAFGYAGQKCSACSRLIVVGSAWGGVVERLPDAVASLVVGPPHEQATVVPPVISEEARRRIAGYIEGAERDGATTLVRGRAPEGGGYYVAPTVLMDVERTSALAREEVFGPVLALFRARDFDEALEIANEASFGLTGGVLSRNPRNIDRARRHFRVGNLYINRRITGAIVGRQPFGGLKLSGFGEKAGGPDYLRQFMEPRVVTENTMRRGFAPAENGASHGPEGGPE